MEKNSFPSVTEILYKTRHKSDLEGLKKWREKVGEEEADRISKESIERGNLYDSYVEDYYRGNKIPHKALNLHLQKYNCHSREKYITSEKHGFYGKYDIVFEYGKCLCLNDFKGSSKPKREEWLGDYLLQISAYTMALIEKGVDIKYSMITVILDNDIQKFLFSIESMEGYFQEFLKRLEQYNSLKK